MSALKQFFQSQFPFNEEGLNDLLNSFKLYYFEKGDILLKSSSIEVDLRFINSGFVREYFATESKEVNINFYGPNEFSSDIYSFYNRTSTKKWQKCLSDVSVQVLSKEKFDTLLSRYQCGESIISKSMQNLIKHKENIEFERTTKEADELYQDLLNHKPTWLQNIPQYHLASYLNVTPETLSRIRKRIS